MLRSSPSALARLPGRVLERTVNVLGNGTLLASASVNYATADKLEQWFRSHPLFGSNNSAAHVAAVGSAPPSDALPSALIADELRKLADLREEGILTDSEFAAQKARLLGS